jgi:hypothetical protein
VDSEGVAWVGLPPTRVFWEKRLQAVENKVRVSEIEDEEAAGY